MQFHGKPHVEPPFLEAKALRGASIIAVCAINQKRPDTKTAFKIIIIYNYHDYVSIHLRLLGEKSRYTVNHFYVTP